MLIKKQHWLERVRSVQVYHVEQLRSNQSHKVEDTAKFLNRSTSSVSDDLQIASWLKTHEKDILRCRTMEEALEFIRHKKREMRLII